MKQVAAHVLRIHPILVQFLPPVSFTCSFVPLRLTVGRKSPFARTPTIYHFTAPVTPSREGYINVAQPT